MKAATVLLIFVASNLAAARPSSDRASASQANTVTARQVVSLIQQHVGVPWRADTVDTFKAGDPDTAVTGIAVTMMATLDVLERASAQHANFIITHEPTFYSHEDKTESLEAANDPVWRDKEAFIRNHHLVVWRFHDHWHLHRPDGILEGMSRALNWSNYQNPSAPNLFTLPAPLSVRQLAADIQKKIGIKVLRVVGNPGLEVTQLALMPGAAGEQQHLQFLRRGDVQVLIIGEVPEWETIEYVNDAATEGKPKALILMGHIPSEQAGMLYCTEWLKQFITGVPVTFVPTREPFWTP